MNVLFVCTANRCRSPIAEVIADQVLGGLGRDDIVVTSAGTATVDGLAANEQARAVAREHGMSLEHHRSVQATRSLLRDSDLVLAMTSAHLKALKTIGTARNAWLLADYASRAPLGRAIADPSGSDVEAYRNTFHEIEAAVRRAVTRMLEEPGVNR
jgi:protein-tyrosine-phosphatase